MVRRIELERFAQVAAAHNEWSRSPARALCVACVEVLGVAGAGLALMSGGRSLDVIGVSDATTESVEQMEYMLDEGPCVGAYRTKAPVFAADLAARGTIAGPSSVEEPPRSACGRRSDSRCSSTAFVSAR